MCDYLERYPVRPETQEGVVVATRWLRPFVREGRIPRCGFLLYGVPGSGKSTLLFTLARELAERWVRFSYFNCWQLQKRLSDGLSDGEGSRILDEISADRDRVIFLDEIGPQRPHDWWVEFLRELINRCYEAERPLLLASVFPLDALPQKWSRLGTDPNEDAQVGPAASAFSRLAARCAVQAHMRPVHGGDNRLPEFDF